MIEDFKNRLKVNSEKIAKAKEEKMRLELRKENIEKQLKENAASLKKLGYKNLESVKKDIEEKKKDIEKALEDFDKLFPDTDSSDGKDEGEIF